MFYSHTFLARKGPLGTVWCAAHLQHKLRKSHYIATNIPSTVERIIDSDVPIALRMSGHLMLGVVRIYSKQVDYMYEDCNLVLVTINRVYTAATVNLPEDADHAPYHSITLPEKFNLDALELDEYYNDLGEDTHIKSRAEITLEEQIPTGKDPFIAIVFDENDMRSSSFAEDNSGPGATPMNEDVPSPVQANTAAGLNIPSPSNQFGADERTVRDGTPDFPSVEIMRDAEHGFQLNGSPILFDRAEPDKFLEEQIIRDNENGTQVMEEVVFSDGHFPSAEMHQELHSTERLNSPTLFAHPSPEMELQATPDVAQPKVMRRKRKQKFDESTVLSNEYMKNALNDTSGLCRVRKTCPSSSLAIWKQNKRLRKDSVFSDLFITGSCADLQDMNKEDVVSAKPHLMIAEKSHQETNAAQTPLPQRDGDREIEVLRNNECASPDRFMPSFSTDVPNPNERSYLTPENSNFGMRSELLETADGDGIEFTADVGASSGHVNSEMETPDTFNRDGFNVEHTALSDIPELVPSGGDLSFLDQDERSPAGSQGTPPEFGSSATNQGTPGLQALSSRTRAVAQFLKRQSPMTPISDNSKESAGELNLNKILQGKPRKICARMFYETLVLKNYDLIDVNQEKPYDEVTLKVTPKLSKEQF